MIVLDEPLSSLDASAQAQLANVLVDLARNLEIGLLLISHDLAIVRYAADAISVMYLGRIVEDGPAGATWETPLHPYTEALIGAVPNADGAGTLPEALPGEVPDPARPPDRLPLPSTLLLSVRPLHGRRAAAASARRWPNGRVLAARRGPHATLAAGQSRHLESRRYPLNVLMFADTVRSPELRHEIPHTVADPFLYGEVGDSRFTVIRSLETQRMREIANVEVVALEELGYDELRAEGRSSGEVELEIAARACRRFGVETASVPPGFPLELADFLRASGVALTVDRELFERRRRSKNEAEIAGIRRAQLAAEAATAAVAAILRASEVDGERVLYEGQPLTSSG